MEFKIFGTAVEKKFDEMTKQGVLHTVSIDKDLLFAKYLDSYPEGTNPMFRKRTEHDCQCCKSFIRRVGNVVAIIDGKLVSIWDVQVGGHFQVVADAMSKTVKECSVNNIFLSSETDAGVSSNFDNNGLPWNHFHVKYPAYVRVRGAEIAAKLGESRTAYEVFERALREITIDAVDTVLDLIAQNSLYRGAEHTFVVTTFRKLKKAYDQQKTNLAKQLFIWSSLHNLQYAVANIRGRVIGTLLTDLSDGKELDDAVRLFESKVAPMNYKRPTALVTKAMIAKAQAKVEELGLTSALTRRFATIEDITINNILFADRTAKKAMNVFDELSVKTPARLKNLDKIEEISIERFLSDVLPTTQSLEVMFENEHANHLVSLIAPAYPDAKPMFKWDNQFSWSYTGELTDSIKERVKSAGGSVDGFARFSLSWSNYDDLDLHMIEPGFNRNEIYFGSKRSDRTGGTLDVDMNAGGSRSRTPVENIVYPDKRQLVEGEYQLVVHQYCQRESVDVGFEVEVDLNGTVYTFAHPNAVPDCGRVVVAVFKYTRQDGFTVVSSIPSSKTSKVVWNIPTQTFQKVNVVMLSPNYWDGQRGIGNKHYFFMLENCLNDGKARGFYNEFLTSDLEQDRKVLEMVGSKMKTDESDRQLTGLGFSSTQHNHLLCRVKGSGNDLSTQQAARADKVRRRKSEE